MAAPSEEKLICDQFNLEALTVNQVKSFKALTDGKDVFIETKTGSGKPIPNTSGFAPGFVNYKKGALDSEPI